MDRAPLYTTPCQPRPRRYLCKKNVTVNMCYYLPSAAVISHHPYRSLAHHICKRAGERRQILVGYWIRIINIDQAFMKRVK